jgi:hypothetical protein
MRARITSDAATKIIPKRDVDWDRLHPNDHDAQSDNYDASSDIAPPPPTQPYSNYRNSEKGHGKGKRILSQMSNRKPPHKMSKWDHEVPQDLDQGDHPPRVPLHHRLVANNQPLLPSQENAPAYVVPTVSDLVPYAPPQRTAGRIPLPPTFNGANESSSDLCYPLKRMHRHMWFLRCQTLSRMHHHKGQLEEFPHKITRLPPR